MTCEFLNKSFVKLKSYVSDESYNNESLNWSECYKGLSEYSSDEDLANLYLFYNYPEPLLKFAAVCCIVFTIIGTTGNLITIIALSKYRKVRNATAIFIINMSCSDFLFSCIIFPIAAELLWKRTWTTGKIMCWLFPSLNYVLTATEAFSIVAITINRYVMVLHPIYYHKLYQSRNITIMIIVIWVGAFTMMTPVGFGLWGRFSMDPRVGFCTIIPDKHGKSPKSLLILMSFIFPSIFIIFCYSRIMYIVKKSTAKSSPKPATASNVVSMSKNPDKPNKEDSSSDLQKDDNDDVESNARDIITRFKTLKSTFKRKRRTPAVRPTRRDKRLRTMITAVMISFFTCHLPILIAKTMNRDWSSTPYGNIIGYLLLFVTTCSNPIIYVVLSEEYRQAYMHIFFKKK